MTTQELRDLLVATGAADALVIGSSSVNEAFVIDWWGPQDWVTCYAERGQRTGLRHFTTEDAACDHLIRTLCRELGLTPPGDAARHDDPHRLR